MDLAWDGRDDRAHTQPHIPGWCFFYVAVRTNRIVAVRDATREPSGYPVDDSKLEEYYLRPVKH